LKNATFAAGLLIGATALQFSGTALAQSDGWVTLVDASRMGEWIEVGKANWAMKDGALTADKITEGKEPSFLVSKTSYKDFQIKAEFWADDDTNSGIFLRCDGSEKIDSRICYEVNIFDKRPDPIYGTGAIVGVAKVDPMPKARPAASGTPSRSPRRARISSSCSTVRRPSTCRTPNTPAVRSRCSTAPA
jgi:3-keto-disaccharide hydrolase